MTRTEIIKVLQDKGNDIEPCEVIKNGVVFDGIRIKPKKKAVSDIVLSPIIYTADIIKKAQSEGKSLCEVVSEIEYIFRESIDSDIQIENIRDRNYVLDNLYIRFQRKSSEKITKRMSMFDGIESYLYIRFNISNNEIGSVKVHEMYLQNLGIDENEAWECAEKNTRNESILVSIERMIMEAQGIVYEDTKENEYRVLPMYVLTNNSRTYGASAIINKKILIDLANKFNTDKIVMLPSSVHETLLLPFETSINPYELSAVVQEVNNMEVKPEERLSDKAYIIEPFSDKIYAI